MYTQCCPRSGRSGDASPTHANHPAQKKADSMTSTNNSNTNDIDAQMSLAAARERFSDLLTADEKKSFDDMDKDAFIEVAQYFDSLNTDEALITELVRYWVDFLGRNEDYEDYCIARRERDAAAIKEFETRYPAGEDKGIAQIYKDFGDIHEDGWSFAAWLAPRRHLFFKSEAVITYATDDATHSSDRS